LVEKKGYRQASRPVLVGTGRNVLRMELKPWMPFSPHAHERRKDMATTEFLGRVSEQLGAHLLLLGDLRRDPGKPQEVILTGQLYDSRSQEFSKIRDVRTRRGKVSTGADTLAKKLLNDITVGGNIIADIGESTPGPGPFKYDPTQDKNVVFHTDKKQSVFTKWWFWTIIGAAVAGGVGIFLLTRQSNPNFNVLDINNPLK